MYKCIYIVCVFVCREGNQFTLFLKVKQVELLQEISVQVRTPRQVTCGRGHPMECSRQFKERGEIKRPLNTFGPFFKERVSLTLQGRSPSTIKYLVSSFKRTVLHETIFFFSVSLCATHRIVIGKKRQEFVWVTISQNAA